MTDLPPGKTGLISVIFTLIGELYNFTPAFNAQQADTFLQHAAWFIAIIVGIFTIINYIRIWCQKSKKDGKD